MKKYVLFDSIIDINKTSPILKATKELLKFLKLDVPTLKNTIRDDGVESMGLNQKVFYEKNAKNLALAAQEKRDILCVEDSSYLSLCLTKEELQKNDELRNEINSKLKKDGLEVNLDTNIMSLASFFETEVGFSKITKKIKNSFDKFYGAIYLGSNKCDIDRFYDTSLFEGILKITGLKSVKYDLYEQSNGYEISDTHEELSHKMAGSLMLDMFDNAADFVIVNDARSFVMFDVNQKLLEKSVGRDIGLSVLCLAQVLMLAFGTTDKNSIGLNEHKIVTKLI